MAPPLPAAARERLAARARRTRLIRRRVLAASLAAFALAWGVIAYDGSMGTTTTTASATAQAAGTSSSSADTSSSSATTAQDGGVTTSQS